MLSPRQEIDKVLAAIREKTGVVIPSRMIFVEETKRMRAKERDGNPLYGEYYNDSQKIFLSPKVFSDVCTDREYHRQLVWGNMTKLAGKFEIINTEEKLTEYVNEYACREIMNVYFVIAHECGHYVHYKYFGGRGVKIPIKHGFGTNGQNSRHRCQGQCIAYVNHQR